MCERDGGMENRKKWVFNCVLLFGITALTLYFILHGQDPHRLYQALELANGWYWLAAIACVFPFVFSESLILYLLLRHVGAKPKTGHCLIYSAIGFFFSCITPAAGGGQPAQVYYMHKDGLNPGTTAPILMVVTVFYKLVLVIAGAVLFIVRPASLLRADDTVLWWAGAGWAVNVVVVAFFALLVIRPEPAERVCLSFFDWLSHRKIRQDRVAHWRAKAERSFLHYHEVSRYLRNSAKLPALVLLISIVQRAILFSVTWLVIRSFGIAGGISAPEIILLQAMVSLGTDMIPLPGGSGVSEAMFLLLFEPLCGEAAAIPVLIASRGISYYGQLLICGAIFLVFGRLIGENGRKRKSDRT